MKPVLRKGQLVTWKDDRGFGFIQASDSDKQVFLHITALKDPSHRPQVGDVIYYQLSVEQNGKARASHASIQGVAPKQSPPSSVSTTKVKTTPKLTRWSSSLALQMFLLSLLPGLGSIHFMLKTANPIPLILYPLMSGITFALYADDKSRAQQGRWRIPEKTLHLCELMGGWLGAFIAQRKLRHKSIKVSYQSTFCAITAVHLCFWLYWFFGESLVNLYLSSSFSK
ncbi:DUF1294 domain-containing protein [Trichocoleus desertorum]|uniref:DUF1294 domain-containing protein n=1 Tax=Trichocoleus desertorum GB2-A4 TaxID=2933944 RepID=A0ABV0JDA6_9CYAN|nr:DUF1294 domain-containing protein [Trichocoleus sp. FACHB-46]MBD1864379.1 cold shock and DUF1294 domain-containing protein [Trichocoleus sp. FACHB-46]